MPLHSPSPIPPYSPDLSSTSSDTLPMTPSEDVGLSSISVKRPKSPRPQSLHAGFSPKAAELSKDLRLKPNYRTLLPRWWYSTMKAMSRKDGILV